MSLFVQNSKYRKAFTLAEILITLLIIGIVTSLVVPAIINDTQNQEFAVLLKKDVSTLSDAAKRMMMDNGGTLAGMFDSHNDMMNDFGNYVIFTKKCTYNTQGCFYSGTNTWKNLYGSYGWLNHTSVATAILSNGGSIMFALDRTDCELNHGTGTPMEHECGWVHIDVNGFKGPNVLGKDLFALWVTKTGIYPFGMPGDGYELCSKTQSNYASGRGCAKVILAGGKVN